MSLLDRVLGEADNYDSESDAQCRGDSTAYLNRMKKRKPKARMSQAAGKWSYNPVDVRAQTNMFTNMMPPPRMSDMESGEERTQIGVRDDFVEDVSERIDAIVGAVFG